MPESLRRRRASRRRVLPSPGSPEAEGDLVCVAFLTSVAAESSLSPALLPGTRPKQGPSRDRKHGPPGRRDRRTTRLPSLTAAGTGPGPGSQL